MKHTETSHLRRMLSTTNVIFFLLLVFLGWASFFELDQTVRAQGKLIPADHTQIIQVADDLKTGGRSVLKYLIKPVYKAFGGALTEK